MYVTDWNRKKEDLFCDYRRELT